ncbi:MAG: uroporphyrinogen-III C-methyltransferase [Candidatus Omnitrophota bacterium]
MKKAISTRKIRIGSRGSRLALVQVEEILLLLKGRGIRLPHVHKIFDTRGDKDKKTSLSHSADNFFTDTLDSAILSEKIDIAIHSAKDLPQELPAGLSIFALTDPLDETDAFVGKDKISRLKKGAKIGTSSPSRREAILRLNPNVKTVEVRGNIDERIKQVQGGRLDGVIIATCALKRLKLEHLITEILPYEATPLQGQLAVVGRDRDAWLKDIFSSMDARKKYGCVSLVGAGPGDPGLITVKAVEALKKADIVFYDYLTSRSLLDHAKGAEKIYSGKRKGSHSLPQPELSRMLRVAAMDGKNVVRLKGGDPLIFGRGADEIQYLRSHHIPVEIIPGVSSVTGIPSALGIPLTARGISSSVAFLSGHGADEGRDNAGNIVIPKTDTIVFLMALSKLPAIIRSLKKAGWKNETPVMIVSRGTYPEEKIAVGTIATIVQIARKINIDPPALIIVGGVVKFWKKEAQANNEFSGKPTFLYLGTHPRKYASLGKIIHFPMIAISEIKFSRKDLASLSKRIQSSQLIILTSRFAVEYFLKSARKAKCSVRKFKENDFAVIGRDTADALIKAGIYPKVTAFPETSQGLLKALEKFFILKGIKILFPRSNLSNPYLKRELLKRGAVIHEVAIYKNQKPAKKNIPKEKINAIIFTSPSTVNNFLADFRVIPKEWNIFAKGPLTQEALKLLGYESEVLS